MTDQPENPPAFPTIGNVAYASEWETEHGMTLRDYVATTALPALITGRDWTHLDDADKPEAWAIAAYVVADAMLRKRGK